MVKRIALTMLFFGAFAFAQHWVEIGTGTAIERYPFDRLYRYTRWEYLYLQEEINYSGLLTHLAFYADSIGDGLAIESVLIYMKETTAVTYPSAQYNLDGYTLVYSGRFPNSPPRGEWKSVALTNPFYYTNRKNLSILILQGPQEPVAQRPYYRYTSTSPNNRGRRAAANGPQLQLYESPNRANIRLGFATTGVNGSKKERTAFSGKGTITPSLLSLSNKEEVGLRIYNIFGKLLYPSSKDMEISFIRNLPAGIYLLRFEAKGDKEERKLVVLR